MGRHDIKYICRVTVAERKQAFHRLDMLRYTIAFRSRHFDLRRPADCNFRVQVAEGKTDAAEAAAETAIEVEEAEMNSRRNRHRGAHRHRAFPAVQKRAPLGVRRGGFFQTKYRITLRHPGSDGNWSSIETGQQEAAMTEHSKERTYAE